MPTPREALTRAATRIPPRLGTRPVQQFNSQNRRRDPTKATSDYPVRDRVGAVARYVALGQKLTSVIIAHSLSVLPNLGRWSSRQLQRGLNAAFQDLLRLDSVGDGPRKLEGAHHEAEDSGRAAAARCRIGIRK